MQRLNAPDSVCHIDTYIYPYMTVRHEYNQSGMHRLVIINRGTKHGGRATSPWYSYEDIAIFPLDGIPDYRWSAICATTEYWRSVFPARVFRVEKLEKWDAGS
jgi:hypothetical protein